MKLVMLKNRKGSRKDPRMLSRRDVTFQKQPISPQSPYC